MNAESEEWALKLALLRDVLGDDPTDTELSTLLSAAKGDVEAACNSHLQKPTTNHKKEGEGRRQSSIVSFLAPKMKTGNEDTHPDPPFPTPRPTVYHITPTGQRHNIPPSELANHVPCSMATDTLPRDFADQLLAALLDAAKGWQRSERVVWHRQIVSPRLTHCFHLPSQSAATHPDSPIENSHDEPYMDMEGDTSPADDQTYAPLIELIARARDIVTRKVEDMWGSYASVAGGEGGHHSGWDANYVVVNVYRSGSDASGWHSDRLDKIGPLPTIASLSLGACRTFRLRAATDQSEEVMESDLTPSPNKKPRLDASSTNQKSRIQTYGVQLPHNTLLVMWPPCQEKWKHDVPPEKSFPVHPLSGSVRVNLTFRRIRPEYQKGQPKCRCGDGCILKPVFRLGKNHGRYFWQCNSKACDFFAWDEDLPSARDHSGA